MILLDTNVISELMRPVPSSAVFNWVAVRPMQGFFLSAVTEAELRFGLLIMPEGARRERLGREFDRILADGFADRVLSFDSAAAIHFARIMSERRASGQPILHPDAQIAAIALAHGMPLATRNLRDFEGTGVTLLDPWAE